MERTEYQKTFEVGKDEEGRRVFLTVELQRRGPDVTTTGAPIVRETVTHEKVTEYLQLSIMGTVQGGGCGQIRDVLDTLSAYTIPEETVQEIGRVWDRWHLNGMNAACVHQTKGDYSRPEIAEQVCPVTGYRYGSAWLVDPLPAEVAAKVKTWGAGQSRRNAYAEQAQEFLQRFGLEIRAAFKGDRCPPWETSCKHIHGDRYRVTVRRLASSYRIGGFAYQSPLQIGVRGRKRLRCSISFDFWNSQAEMQAGGRPSAYTILAMLSAEASAPTSPDEVVAEFGEMRPSQALAVARFAQKLQNFFTAEELEALGEIR